MKLAVLASGYGSNLQAIIDATKRGVIDGRVVLVISDQRDAYALKRAEKHQIEARYLNPKNYASREDYDSAVIVLLKERGIDLVVLAGYMRLLSPVFIDAFPGRIMNIHPSLLPSFPGLGGVGQALKYGVKVSGCTVHFVDENLDTGPIILQEAVPFTTMILRSLYQRIHSVEHRLYPESYSAVHRANKHRREKVHYS